MSDNFEDYFDWDFQISKCEVGELTASEVTKAKRAFQFLKIELGDDFPRSVWTRRNVMMTYFGNTAPWTRAWFIWFAEAIKELKNADNFSKVQKKLNSKEYGDCEEAISLLEYALKFKKAGFEVEFEKPVTNIKGQQKNPDLKLKNSETSEEIFVEVTRLGNNKELHENFGLGAHAKIRVFSYGKPIYYSGQLFKFLSQEHLKEITRKVDEAAEEAIKNNSLGIYEKKGVIEIAFGVGDGVNDLKEWVQEKKYRINHFLLPPFDALKGIKGKIIGKSSQTSESHFNLLIIEAEDRFYTFDPGASIDELEETLYKCNSLSGVMICSHEFGGREENAQAFGMNSFISRTDRYARGATTTMIFNKFHKTTPITLHSFSRLVEAFEKH